MWCGMAIGMVVLLIGIAYFEYCITKNTSSTNGRTSVGECALKTGTTCRVSGCNSYRNAVCRNHECVCPENTCAIWSIKYTGRVCRPVLETKAWVHPMANYFPEDRDPYIRAKASTGIAFSGGGNRAYTASLGVAMAFNQLYVIDDVKYMSGVSGGSWFTGVYTYGRVGGIPIPLPPVIPPNMLTAERIGFIGKESILYPPTQHFFKSLVLKLASPNHKGGYGLDEAWTKIVREVYFAPFGAGAETYWTLDSASEQQARQDNPAYFVDKPAFLTMSDPRRPYPIIVSGDLGPANTMRQRRQLNVNLVESTPLYTGEPGFFNDKYTAYETLAKGGYIQTFAYGTGQYITNLQEEGGSYKGKVRVVAPAHPYAIYKASGTSSSYGGVPFIVLKDGGKVPAKEYGEATSEEKEATVAMKSQHAQFEDLFMRNFIGNPTYGDAVIDLFDDGGTVEFMPLISQLVRGVENIFAGDWSATPIVNALRADRAFCEITPYFGVFEGDCTKYSGNSYAEPRPGILGDYAHNHVFSSYELQPLLDQLWAKVKAGEPAIVATTMTTVENRRYAIPAGRKHNIIWAFLGGPSESFLNGLPEHTRAGMHSGKWGSFKDFPRYATAGQNKAIITDINYTPQQVNLLAQEMAYQVLQFDYHTGLISKWFGGNYAQAKEGYASYGFSDYGAVYAADYEPAAYVEPATYAAPAAAYAAPAEAKVAEYSIDGSLSDTSSAQRVDDASSIRDEARHHAASLVVSVGLIVAGLIIIVGSATMAIWKRRKTAVAAAAGNSQQVEGVALVVAL